MCSYTVIYPSLLPIIVAGPVALVVALLPGTCVAVVLEVSMLQGMVGVGGKDAAAWSLRGAAGGGGAQEFSQG